MGYGNYSYDAHTALVARRANQARAEVFKQTQCHALMNPKGLKVRECRDSPDHPQSLGIVFALDVTGSMGDIPHLLAKKELPNLMKVLTLCGVPDPQVMFMAVGDATADHASLQVGQFESTAELMDQWLTWSYLEGGGGGTGQESYELAFYTAAQHTDTDNWVKRKQKGYFFVTGDEFPYPAVSRHQVEALLGEKLDEDIPVEEVVAAAAESYHLFFLIPDQGRAQRVGARWRELLGDHTISMESPKDTCYVAAAIVGLTEKKIPSLQALADILKNNGLERSQIGSVIQAVQPYASLLHLPEVSGLGSNPSGDSWWKSLFK